MTKADIYALYIEVSHNAFAIFSDVVQEEQISLFKEEILREKIRIIELGLKNVLFEIECFENSKENKNKLFKLKLLLLFFISLVSFIINPFLGIGITYFGVKKAKDLYEDAKFECMGANLEKVKWHLNNSLNSLGDCKKHLDTLAQKRDLQLEKERMEKHRTLNIDKANIALGEYLITEEIPEMSDETRWELIKMLRADLNTEELDLNRLLDMALSITPMGVIESGVKRRLKKRNKS